MNERPAWVPDGISVDMPSAARVYDYLLGGAHNFPADRAIGDEVLRVLPASGQIAGANRSFLRRAVLHMVEQGITQFLDLGSGIPTVGNVHEVARKAEPSCRVVYVDYDEVAVAHTELLLGDDDAATMVAADIRRIDDVLGTPAIGRLLDFSQPVGLLMVAVLHFVPDEQDPGAILAGYRDAMPAGSLIAVSHVSGDHRPAQMAEVADAMRASRDPVYLRTYDHVLALFDGLELVEPGVVSAPLWRPEPAPYDSAGPQDVYAGMGRKPNPRESDAPNPRVRHT